MHCNIDSGRYKRQCGVETIFSNDFFFFFLNGKSGCLGTMYSGTLTSGMCQLLQAANPEAE